MKQSGSIILAELPTEQVLTTIAGLLHDNAKLFQVPNWDIDNSAHLASWILRNYKYEQLQDIVGCLQNPPEIYNERGEKEKSWRLTPDTVRAWLTAYLEKSCDRREREIENQRKEEGKEIAPLVQKLLIHAVKQLEPETKKTPFLLPKIFNIDGLEVEATSIEEARLIHREIFERWEKEGNGVSFNDWINESTNSTKD